MAPLRTRIRVWQVIICFISIVLNGWCPSALASKRLHQHQPKQAYRGVASWYGPGFAGRRTASGQRFNPYAMTAASRTLPLGTKLKVQNPRNGRSCTVLINDRGPYVAGRQLDLSEGAAQRLGIGGVGPVVYYPEGSSTLPLYSSAPDLQHTDYTHHYWWRARRSRPTSFGRSLCFSRHTWTEARAYRPIYISRSLAYTGHVLSKGLGYTEQAIGKARTYGPPYLGKGLGYTEHSIGKARVYGPLYLGKGLRCTEHALARAKYRTRRLIHRLEDLWL
jgi:hypothetical protein